MFDTLETIDHSLVQHGPASDRIYLMKLSEQDVPDLPGKLDALAEHNSYSKIFAKVAAPFKTLFETHGYIEEARVPNFYNGQTDGLFLAKYIDPEREIDPEQKTIEHIIELAEQKGQADANAATEPPFAIRTAEEADADRLAGLYKEVFESYPFPIHEPDYLIETMRSHILYFLAFDGAALISASSAEMDSAAQNAEMTDFATLPAYRGRGLAQYLLATMERYMARHGIQTGYTIARALSAGMNITFAKNGYHYGGTLTNNTNICGRIESMNVWYKPLSTG